jgi:hypothetical protein
MNNQYTKEQPVARPIIYCQAWAARYNTWLLIKLTPKGVVFSFLFLLPSSVIDPRLGRGRQRKIWIVEGGYCADTRYAEKVKEESEHKKLVDMLKMYGYDV